MNVNPKSVSDGYLLSNRLYSFEETPKEAKDHKSIKLPAPIQEIESFDPAEYWEAINDRDQRIEALFNQNEVLIQEKAEADHKNQELQKSNETLKAKMVEMEQEYSESCRKYEKNIAILEKKLFEINEKLEKSTKLIETFEESSKVLETLMQKCQNDELSEEGVEFQVNLEKNFEQMQMIENANATIYKETIETLKKGYEEKLDEVKKSYEEKLKEKNKTEENKEETVQKLEKINEICMQFAIFEEKAKSLGYSGIDEALEQNKLLWEEVKSLRKIQETYKNENDLLHHELDSYVEKFDLQEKDFQVALARKEQFFQTELQGKLAVKDSEIQSKTSEFEAKFQEMSSELDKTKKTLSSINAEYEESLQKIQQDRELIANMKNSLDITEKNNSLYIKQLSDIKSGKVKQTNLLFRLLDGLKSLKQAFEQTKKDLRSVQKSLETHYFSEIRLFVAEFLQKVATVKSESQNQSSLNISRNLTTVESEIGLEVKNSIQIGFEKKHSNFNDNLKKVSSSRPIYGEVQDFSDFVTKDRKSEDSLTMEMREVKENLEKMQKEHMKIAEIVEQSLKSGSGASSKVKNEFVLFNYFEKLFDRLSLSLQKENEIKSMIYLIDEKLERNLKEPGVKTFELENLKFKNNRLVQDIQEKTEYIAQLEAERNDYKKACKELQIQLDFKNVQTKFRKENTESQIIKEPDVSLIYQKYLKTNNLRQTEPPIRNVGTTPRTPTGKDINKTIAKTIQDHQKTKNGKLNQSKNSDNYAQY